MPEHSTQIDAASYLRQLCQAISLSKLECRGIRLVLAAQSLRMDSEACWRLGMVVSELVTNAARHAFGEGGGEIRVELRLSQSFDLSSARTQDRGGAGRRTRRQDRATL
jgi:two-component sensor histidine kinase